jgi:YggT family protein
MFVIANFINAVAYVLDFLLTIYMYVLIARAILSWVNPDPYNPIVSFLYRATEPLLQRVRKIVPAAGPIDLSPLLVLLGIFFMQKFVVTSLFELGNRMKFGFGG